MIKGEPYEIKLEEERENELRFGLVRRRHGTIKIEYDPALYPPIKWAPLKLVTPPAEANEVEAVSEQNPSSNWVKIMKKTLTRLLSTYISSIQKSNFLMKFKKWRHSSTFIFAVLMYVTHNISHLKNSFCDSYQVKIQNFQSGKYEESDMANLKDSVRIVLEFFIGEPIIAIEEFYRKYRSELSYDSLKAKKLLKIVERAIVDEQDTRQIELDFASGDIYQDQEDQRGEEGHNLGEKRSNRSMKSHESEDNPHSSQIKSIKMDKNQNIFLIYRKDDASKTALYPIDTNFTIKHAFNDLFPS